MFARWVDLPLILHGVDEKFREPIVRLVLIVEQDPRAFVQVVAGRIWNMWDDHIHSWGIIGR